MVTIPALTPVIVEILTDLSSKKSKTGQLYPLRLAVPIIIDGRVVVPAGTIGEGEVLNAKSGGMSGSSGVLMLVAHDLKVDGRSLRLRSMHLAQSGSDHTRAASITGMLPYVGVLGLFVTGGETKIATGTYASAKTAEDFQIRIASPSATPQVSPTEGSTQ